MVADLNLGLLALWNIPAESCDNEGTALMVHVSETITGFEADVVRKCLTLIRRVERRLRKR